MTWMPFNFFTFLNPSEVCMFGARLQRLDDDTSLWVLSQLKSERGYWKEYESEAYRRTQGDLMGGEDESETADE